MVTIIIIASVSGLLLYLRIGLIILQRLFLAYAEEVPKSTSRLERCVRRVRGYAAVIIWPIVSLLFVTDLYRSLTRRCTA